MPLDSPDEATQQMIVAVRDGRNVNIATAAAVAWVFWEMIITYDQEIRLIWKRRFSLYQVLYLLLRYCTPAALVLMFVVQTSMSIKYNVKFCQGYLMYLGFGLLIPECCGEALIVLRLYALYGRSRKILALTIFLYCGRMVTAMYCVVTENLTVIVISPDIPISGCISTPPTNNQLSVVSVSVSAFVATTFFFLTLYKFLGSVPPNMWRQVRALRETAPLLRLLLRDATGYLAVLLAAEVIFLALSLRFVNRQLSLMGFPWIMATYFIAGTRLVLNLRGETMTDAGDPAAQHGLELRPRKRPPTKLVFADPRDLSTAGTVSEPGLGTSASVGAV